MFISVDTVKDNTNASTTNIVFTDSVKFDPLTASRLLTLDGSKYTSNAITGANLNLSISDENAVFESFVLTGGVGIAAIGDLSTNRTITVDLDELATEATIDASTDFIVMVDATDSGSGKILLDNIPNGYVTETSIASGDFISMVDITDSKAGKITFANLEGAIAIENIGGTVPDDIVGGTGITATNGANTIFGGDATISLDLTEINSTTFGSGTFTTLTFDAGAVDPVWTYSSGNVNLSTGTLQVGGVGVLTAEINDLEADDPPNVLINEFYIGTGSGTGAWVVLSGDVTNVAGAITVVDDSHNHVITNIDAFTVAQLQTQTSDVTTFYTEDTIVPVVDGGSGAGTFTDGGILLGSGTGAFTALGVATNGQIPIGDNSTDPVLATITAGGGIGVANGAGTITISGTDTGMVELSFNAFDTTATNGSLTFEQTGKSKRWGFAASTIDTLIFDGTVNLPDFFAEWIGWSFTYSAESTGADTLIVMTSPLAHDEPDDDTNLSYTNRDTVVSATGPAANDARLSTELTAFNGTFAADDKIYFAVERPAGDAGIINMNGSLKLYYRRTQ